MTKKTVLQQFGAQASDYVNSATHARGASLPRLVELLQPQADWHVLDIATGAGHTAIAFAPHVAHVRATFLALHEIKEPGSVVHLPFEWPETPKEVRSHPQEPPPIAKAISRRPWLYRNLLNGDIPD